MLTSLDSFAVATPVITLPRKQREGFQSTAGLWHSLFSYCPSSTSHLIANLTNEYEKDMAIFLERLIEQEEEEDDAVLGRGGREGGGGRSVDKSTSKLKFRFGIEGLASVRNGGGGGGGGGGDVRRSSLFHMLKSFSPPVVENIDQMSQLAISLSTISTRLVGEVRAEEEEKEEEDEDKAEKRTSPTDLYSNPLRKYLRGVMKACRGALFHDDTYAKELRTFIVAASKSAEKSGHLYPPAAGKAFIPLLR
jgi:hypothetical protein